MQKGLTWDRESIDDGQSCDVWQGHVYGWEDNICYIGLIRRN